jgi:DNA-binding NarL/FixJ family response regulator
LFNDDRGLLSLGDTVRAISEGKMVYSREIVERYLQLSELTLTPRERDVVLRVANGLSNTGTGKALSISCATVRNHLSRIYAKLGVPQDGDMNPRVCLVNRVRRLGLVE